MKKVLIFILAATALAATSAGILLHGIVFPHTPKSIANLRFIGFIPLPGAGQHRIFSVADYLAVHDKTLFIASTSSGAIIRVPLSADPLPRASEVMALPGTPGVHGVAFDPISGMGFASRSGADTVDVLDPHTMQIRKRIKVVSDADGIFFDPEHGLIYLANGDQQVATVIDPRTQTSVAKIKLTGKPEFAAFDPTSHMIYQNLEDINRVAAVDLAARQEIANWPIAGCTGPTGMAIDVINRRLFIVCRNKVFVAFSLRITGSSPHCRSAPVRTRLISIRSCTGFTRPAVQAYFRSSNRPAPIATASWLT